MLKDNAISKLFNCNKDKQPLTRKTSCARLQIVNKKQLCEEVSEHSDPWGNHKMEINSKGVQTNQDMISIGT